MRFLAVITLALLVLTGCQTTPDYAAELTRIRPLAEQGDAKAQNRLGDMYLNSKGVTKDYAEALRWFRKAAKQGHAAAQFWLGYMYADGRGVTQDDKEALRWWRKAAKRGHAAAQYLLGDMYHFGEGVTKDYKEAVRWYRKAAEQGHADAQFFLATLYHYGLGVTKDHKEAVRWYRKAAVQGDATAQYYLASLEKQPRAEGNRPPRSRQAKAKPVFTPDYKVGRAAYYQFDSATALKHFRPLAKQGHARAQYRLGRMYARGRGVTQDYKEAIRWYRKAAKQGHAAAQFWLGYMYADGRGVTQDDKEALRWWRKAAKRGHAAAQYLLGDMYRYGQGVTKDYKEAVRWYRKAAEQGHSSAQYYLALFEKRLRAEGNWPPRSRQASKPTVTAKKTPPKVRPKPKPKALPFKAVPKRPDDIAVIVANSNYKKLGKGIPNVEPAYNDAKNIKKYFMKSLGVREGNIIYLKDATGTHLTSVFGSEKDHKGKLFNWVKPSVSKVYVYYAGHGAPAGKEGTTYLVPSDTDNETVQLTAYPLKQLYANLGKLPATAITVILEACFSGQSQGGNLTKRTSGITITPKVPRVPTNITVISAGAADQVASWEKNGSQSLFTKYFLKGMSGEGDKRPYGDGDGKVSLKELKKYLDGDMTYYARRYYGRTQQAQIVVNGRELLAAN